MVEPGCEAECSQPSHWSRSTPSLLLVSTALQLVSALPASLVAVRWLPSRVSAGLAGLVLSSLLLLVTVLARTSAHTALPALALLSLLAGLHLVGVTGQAARLPARHTAGLAVGGTAAGAVTCLLELTSLLPRPTTHLTYSLILLLASYLLAFDSHFALPLSVSTSPEEGRTVQSFAV